MVTECRGPRGEQGGSRATPLSRATHSPHLLGVPVGLAVRRYSPWQTPSQPPRGARGGGGRGAAKRVGTRPRDSYLSVQPGLTLVLVFLQGNKSVRGGPWGEPHAGGSLAWQPRRHRRQLCVRPGGGGPGSRLRPTVCGSEPSPRVPEQGCHSPQQQGQPRAGRRPLGDAVAHPAGMCPRNGKPQGPLRFRGLCVRVCMCACVGVCRLYTLKTI